MSARFFNELTGTYLFIISEIGILKDHFHDGTSASDLHAAPTRKDKKDEDKEGDNNIEVSVLSEPAFTIWQNGYATSTIYESGRVAQGTVQADVPAGAGIYYLVFSNKLSPKTPKTVHANVLLRYKSWLPEWFRRMKGRLWNWLGL